MPRPRRSGRSTAPPNNASRHFAVPPWGGCRAPWWASAVINPCATTESATAVFQDPARPDPRPSGGRASAGDLPPGDLPALADVPALGSGRNQLRLLPARWAKPMKDRRRRARGNARALSVMSRPGGDLERRGNGSSPSPGSAVSSWPACQDAAEEETEAEYAIAVWTGIHDFLLHLTDHLLVDRPGIRRGSRFIVECDGLFAVWALGHKS